MRTGRDYSRKREREITVARDIRDRKRLQKEVLRQDTLQQGI